MYMRLLYILLQGEAVCTIYVVLVPMWMMRDLTSSSLLASLCRQPNLWCERLCVWVIMIWSSIGMFFQLPLTL
jgi:hypothetical protein